MSLPRRTFLVADPSGLGWDLVSRPEDMSPVRGARLAATEDVGADPFVVDYHADRVFMTGGKLPVRNY